MPWVSLSDDFYDDPKLIDAGPLGLAQWVVGLTWCARNLTDGFIPARQIRRLLDWDGVALEDADVTSEAVAKELVRCGLWDEVDGGYMVSNYHKYQPTREQVLSKRAKDKARKQTRPGSGGSPSAVPEESPEIPSGFHAESTRNPAAPLPPPSPLPETPPPPTDTRAAKLAHKAVVVAVQAEKDAGAVIRSVQAVVRTTRWPAEGDELTQRAERWLEQFEVSDEELVRALAASPNVPPSWTHHRRTA